MMPRALAGQRGVSLIEALAALAIMGFGLLGVVGMQATLRASSDGSRQRAEAVRIAQARIEDWRAFEQLGASAATDYADVATATTAAAGGNAAFTVTATVTLPAPPVAAPDPLKLKSVRIDIDWRDRADQTNTVRLATAIAGIAPELGGALGLPTDRSVTQRPLGRNRGIPPTAVDLVDAQGNKTGFSSFTPPGAPSGVSWTFNNISGLITALCTAPGVCTADKRQLLSGFVRFATIVAPPTPATGATQPTGNDSELPAGPAFALGVQVNVALPAVSTEICYTQTSSMDVAYHCALPTTTTPPHRWSGRSVLTGLPLSAVVGDNAATNYKVCRYTPSATDTPPDDADHPLDYSDVAAPLAQQNFLVIHAGNGSAAGFSCPGDGPSPFVNSFTYAHQPR